MQSLRKPFYNGSAAGARPFQGLKHGHCNPPKPRPSPCRVRASRASSSANEAAPECNSRRRQALLGAVGVSIACSVAGLLPVLSRPAAAEEETVQPNSVAATAASSPAGLQLYENKQQQYRLSIPEAWERKEKAGADVLFEDPGRRSTSVGVTVSPVRVRDITAFGDLQAVGQRLLDAERKKESTLGVELLSVASRQGSAGATLYDYEYQLDSTRGIKRIFNTVTITDSKLYIVNGNFKCDKEAGCDGADAIAAISVLRQVAASFDAGSSSQ